MIPEMYFALADKYGNVVGSANTGSISIRVDDTYGNGTYSKTVEGKLTFKA